MLLALWLSLCTSSRPIQEDFRLKSATFGNTRTIRVLLPPCYNDPSQTRTKYPVLYLNDGVTVFKPAAIGIADVVDTLLRSGSIEPLIVVGIDNGASTDTSTNPGIDRAAEYLPYPDSGFPSHQYVPEVPVTRGQSYPDFLVSEVMPAIAGRYRVSRHRSDIGVGGWSYGGDAALYACLTRPKAFGKLYLESTPLWIGPDRQILRDAQRSSTWPARVYLGLGTAETPDEVINREGQADFESLKMIIARHPKTLLKVTVEPDAKHEPAAWRRRLPGALQFLFPPKTAR